MHRNRRNVPVINSSPPADPLPSPQIGPAVPHASPPLAPAEHDDDHPDEVEEADDAPQSALDKPSARPDSTMYNSLWKVVKAATKWRTGMDSQEWLSKLQKRLRASPVDTKHWIYILPLLVSKDGVAEEWIQDNIVGLDVSWNTAKILFNRHFGKADWIETQKRLYRNCLQQKNESVQVYSDRFLQLSKHLKYPDDHKFNIDNYIEGLVGPVHARMIETRVNRQVPREELWEFTSLQDTIEDAIMAESLIGWVHQALQPKTPRGSQAASTESPAPSGHKKHKRKFEQSTAGDDAKQKKQKQGKQCKFHPQSKSHTTEECRTGPKQQTTEGSATNKHSPSATATPGADRNTGEQICYRCKQPGHFANKCPNKSQSGSTAPNKYQPKMKVRQATILDQELESTTTGASPHAATPKGSRQSSQPGTY